MCLNHLLRGCDGLCHCYHVLHLIWSSLSTNRWTWVEGVCMLRDLSGLLLFSQTEWPHNPLNEALSWDCWTDNKSFTTDAMTGWKILMCSHFKKSLLNVELTQLYYHLLSLVCLIFSLESTSLIIQCFLIWTLQSSLKNKPFMSPLNG